MNLFSRVSSLPAISARLRKRYVVDDPRLKVSKFGLTFPNPVGLAAGFDKEGRWFNQLANIGFGCIEIGTVTGQAQLGNPKPRLFRLPDDRALINRLGFNSSGCQSVARELADWTRNRSTACVLGINIGKSKIIELKNAPAEYQKSFQQLFEFADYFTINVSSPNTPNLRELQNRDHLIAILEAIRTSNERISSQKHTTQKPVLLKIAPDLTDPQLAEVAAVACDHGLHGIIATNTTISRSNLRTPTATIEKIGVGGLSGRPLHARSREVVSKLYQHLNGRIPIIGVGGITNGNDAWNMITAGADLVQLYTGFIYGGPALIRDINCLLLKQLEQHDFSHISEAVGTR